MTIDPNNVFQRRIEELEAILNEYKNTSDEINEIKISDNRVYPLNNVNKNYLFYSTRTF